MAETLRTEIIKASAALAHKNDEFGKEQGITLQDYIIEYTEQFDEGSYLTYLRAWLGYMIEQGNADAVEIMKNLIKYKLGCNMS
jgi:hypothetical protein